MAYNRGFTQVAKDGLICTILMKDLAGRYKADFSKWVAEKYPRNTLLERNRSGRTPLHIACRSLTRHLGDDSSEIVTFGLPNCPESVRVLDNNSRLPINLLLRLCQHRPVKEVVVCLLREYPESYGMVSGYYRVPSSIPFVQRIKPLLDEERELKENVADLQELSVVSVVFQDAVDGTDNPSPLATSTYIVFDSWATSFDQHLEARMEQISNQLHDECTM